ncbi:MAG: hypothetical protein IJ165_12665 [Proteobacteria bacterium]|nr:hypothetical protein [Pseudomonadota bacterium]
MCGEIYARVHNLQLQKKGVYINAPSPLIVPGDLYILAVLNSPISDWYIHNLSVARSGGYYEYKPIYIEQIPVPRVDNATRIIISDYSNRLLISDECEMDRKLLDALFDLYNLSSTEREYIRNYDLSNHRR